ncbi:NAD(P)-dependent oxidoreductase [Crocinitomicaceae bacterium]|nr:NAD(P)-dependent oxidoreductase [Crocinitomicaceae bacterium]
MSLTKKILLTGATGAIGTEILKQLKSQNRLSEVVVLVRDSKKTRKKLKPFEGQITLHYGDVTKPESLAEACQNVSVVIHLAGIIPPLSEDNPELGRRVNIEGTRNLIKAVETHSPDAFYMFSSSVVVYGDRLKTPNITVSDPLEKVHNDHYGLAKIEAESILQNSSLRWSIFRLTAIMGIGNHEISGIMFIVPLDTPMEICTIRDTARAYVNSLDQQEQLERTVYNLGGGKSCRISYKEFMSRAFNAFGMGAVNFPEYAFARQNFHCGYYADGDDLEEILHFRSDTIDTYFERFRASVPPLQRIVTRPFAGIIKWFLTRLSKPLKAYKQGDKERIKFYFGAIEK